MKRGLLEQFQEGRQDSFGHPPEHTGLEVVSGALDDSAVPTVLHRAVSPGTEECVEGHPPGAGHFGIRVQWHRARKREHERPHQDWWKDRGPRGKIIQDPDQGGVSQINRHLFERLAPRGRDEVDIANAPATARKGELPRPAVVLALRAANEKDAIGIGGEDDRDGGVRAVGLVFSVGSAGGQSGRELWDPAQCT